MLHFLDISSSNYYRPEPKTRTKKTPGPPPLPIPFEDVTFIQKVATNNPWYGYKKIAVISRWSRPHLSNRTAYRVMKSAGLLKRRRRIQRAKLHHAKKLYELLPKAPNELWQMDVTYIHIPGSGWRYAVTVIDYYSRYLLALHLTDSYSANEAVRGLEIAYAKATEIHGTIKKRPFLVTDNGSSFIAKRFTQFIAEDFSHVRIQYRTPTQLGLLERFHKTLKEEEVYWRLYNSVPHARKCLSEFHDRYNHKRPHWGLIPEKGGDPITPNRVYCLGEKIRLPKWQKWAIRAKQELDQELKKEVA